MPAATQPCHLPFLTCVLLVNAVPRWTAQDDMRVLAHFYTFEHFMDPELEKAVKRFVRNYIHYRDEASPACIPNRLPPIMPFRPFPLTPR